MDADTRKLEAERLSKDPIFLEAISNIRARALESLVRTDPSKTVEIARLQALALVCDGMQAELAAMINSAAQRRPFKAV